MQTQLKMIVTSPGRTVSPAPPRAPVQVMQNASIVWNTAAQIMSRPPIAMISWARSGGSSLPATKKLINGWRKT